MPSKCTDHALSRCQCPRIAVCEFLILFLALRLKDLGASGSPTIPRRQFRDPTANPLTAAGLGELGKMGRLKPYILTILKHCLSLTVSLRHQIFFPIVYIMERKEYIFKEVDGVSIDADVYFRRDQSATSPVGQSATGTHPQLFESEEVLTE